jgi:pimeloyl-ACP methyl ester carboxylesterase
VVGRVGAPVLVVAGEEDLLCPPGPAAELARRAPEGELELLPLGHFDLYDGASIDLEAAFLSRHLA